MPLTIHEPQGDQPCTEDGEVCVKGDGAIKSGMLACQVCAKIYQPPDKPSNPSAGPPSGVSCTEPNADGSWCIGMVGGADGSGQQPYPPNTVWVWAEYREDCSSSSSSSSSSSGAVWEVANESFNGKEQTSVPECC